MKRLTGTSSELVQNKQNEDIECKKLRLSDGCSEEIYIGNEVESSHFEANLNIEGDSNFCDGEDSPSSSTTIQEDHLVVANSDDSSQMFNEHVSFECKPGTSDPEGDKPIPRESVSVAIFSDSIQMFNENIAFEGNPDASDEEGDKPIPKEDISGAISSHSSIICDEAVSTGSNSNSPEDPNVLNSKYYGDCCSDAPLKSENGDNHIEVQPLAYTNDISEMRNSYDAENLTTSLLQVVCLEGHSDDILSVAVDGDIIISASADTSVKVWNALDQNQLCSFRGHTAAVTSVVLFSIEQTSILARKMMLENVSRIAVTGSLDCTCRLWSLTEGKEISSFYTYNGITCVKYFEAELYVVISTDGGKLEVWELCSSSLVHSVFAHEDLISDISIDMNYIYSVSVDGMIKVWLLEEKLLQLLYTRRRKEIGSDHINFNPCQWKAVSSFQSMLYLGDNSSQLKVLDWRSGKLKILQNELFQSGATDVLCTFSNMLLSSSYDTETSNGAIHVWLLPELKYVCSLLGDVQNIFSLAMTETDEGALRIVSAGSQLIVWDFDFSQPPSNKNESSFYCISLEQTNVDVPVNLRAMSSQLAKVNSSAESIKNKVWGCNIF